MDGVQNTQPLTPTTLFCSSYTYQHIKQSPNKKHYVEGRPTVPNQPHHPPQPGGCKSTSICNTNQVHPSRAIPYVHPKFPSNTFAISQYAVRRRPFNFVTPSIPIDKLSQSFLFTLMQSFFVFCSIRDTGPPFMCPCVFIFQLFLSQFHGLVLVDPGCIEPRQTNTNFVKSSQAIV